ncbi:MAG TPA: DUF3617 domain-containing protein [Nevskiaceae bacterium]|nr:DUF3617 domain-containing protein [Nevskiaceae bacterium]
MKYTTVILACSLTALPLAANADAKTRKPGLWEVTTQMKFDEGGPQIPPDALEKMKALGMKIPGMGGEPIVIKQCLTKEQAEKEQAPQTTDKKNGCKTTDFKRSGGKFSAKMVCDGSMKGEGQVEGNYASNGEAYDGTWKFAGTETGHGKPHDVKMSSTFSGKFIGSDCGDTKPFDY